ncbi:B-cell receptor CD22-like [Alosa alosa]|uniref:B-cell receptor CD22-like n=1 Tax=Alosa alosa TaxID=278164 RepID=UPI0020151144|nr:B-cell receptor CD22-like [Alosa alosa]
MTSETVTEGGEVTLTCSTCTQSNNPTLIWYKNNQPVSNQHTTRDNKLHLNPVSSEDAGSYSCAVKGDESLSSTAVFLNVRYVPKNVSVSIKASSKIEDSVVTLTCSSDANPPVHTYTWYMKSGAESLVRGTGESVSFNLTSDTSGLYYCEAHNEVGSTNSSQTPVQIVTEDDHVAAMMFQAGIILFVILTITLVFATLWLSYFPARADASDVYDNVMPTTMTSDPGQRVDSQGMKTMSITPASSSNHALKNKSLSTAIRKELSSSNNMRMLSMPLFNQANQILPPGLGLSQTYPHG